MDIREIARNARRAAEALVSAPTAAKNAALGRMARLLSERQADVLSANEADRRRAAEAGTPAGLVKRLGFGEAKLASRIRCLEKIRALPDPVGRILSTRRMDNGMMAARMRVPLGVILMIYEARPHVTVNAGAFCLKSGNAAILRGGSEARDCNALLGEIWRAALAEAGLPEAAVQVVSGSHEEIGELLTLTDEIDLVIPRGGPGLIRAVAEQSRIPVIKHFAGVCHVYVDRDADLESALRITLDSKCLMPEVCNAMETLLVHESHTGWLGSLVGRLGEHGVTVRGCRRTREAVPGVEAATEEDWSTEYLDHILSLRVVGDVGEAASHINTWGSHHTDVIVTDSLARSRRFIQTVDSAVVLVNASTMFCDGESLGMGAEIGISTDKLHARGPMGLEELTSYKHVLTGEGHVMGEADAWKGS
jgi:glutamate-5-semialdehyde dehydrogenase